MQYGMDLFWGWCFWSLAHNLGHRWWHVDMKKGVTTFYAHGESEHHRIYDGDIMRDRHFAEDPQELFISFPFKWVAAVAAIPALLYGFGLGPLHGFVFAIAMYSCMLVDHKLHVRFHTDRNLTGLLAKLQEMHYIHHATHSSNFFFVSGIVWDLLFRTAVTKYVPLRRHAHSGH